jgi:phospholipid-binding lipoprotein MlaA
MRAVPPLRLMPARCLVAIGLTSLSLLSLTACAHKPPASDPEAVADYEQTNDPIEPTNRFFYRVNTTLDTYALKPVAKGYRYVVPARVRTGLHNVLGNLSSPILFANDVMQAKPRRVGDTFMRFLINSSVGVLGVFDVATDWGYPAHDTDFGITLAMWGLPEGPFLFLPVLGPSNPRDLTGFAGDIGLDPFTYVPHGYGLLTLNWGRSILGAIDQRERVLDDLDQIQRNALDPYATFRSLYRQHRQSQIEDTENDKRATTPNWFSK